ncbi:MAG TPA: hypothetical protein VGR26_14965 [Acidimicrobiales bacterium]|nr:hypothetical protein [Acidimicrobiales bacterium]
MDERWKGTNTMEQGETTTEWRVSWRREDWRPATKKSRRFATKPLADAFLAKLMGTARPDLSRVVDVRLEERQVGPWETCR